MNKRLDNKNVKMKFCSTQKLIGFNFKLAINKIKILLTLLISVMLEGINKLMNESNGPLICQKDMKRKLLIILKVRCV